MRLYLSMKKSELIRRISEHANVSLKDSQAVLNALCDVISKELAEGKDVSLVNFGTFKRSYRASRTGVNPRTKEQIQIPASYSCTFKIGKSFKDLLNKEIRHGKQ